MKSKVFGKFHSWGHSNNVFNFLKFQFYYVHVVHLTEKKYDFLELKL